MIILFLRILKWLKYLTISLQKLWKTLTLKATILIILLRQNLDFVGNAIDKFKNYLSILRIKENVQVNEKFSFSTVKEYDFVAEIFRLDTRNPHHSITYRQRY